MHSHAPFVAQLRLWAARHLFVEHLGLGLDSDNFLMSRPKLSQDRNISVKCGMPMQASLLRKHACNQSLTVASTLPANLCCLYHLAV